MWALLACAPSEHSAPAVDPADSTHLVDTDTEEHDSTPTMDSDTADTGDSAPTEETADSADTSPPADTAELAALAAATSLMPDGAAIGYALFMPGEMCVLPDSGLVAMVGKDRWSTDAGAVVIWETPTAGPVHDEEAVSELRGDNPNDAFYAQVTCVERWTEAGDPAIFMRRYATSGEAERPWIAAGFVAPFPASATTSEGDILFESQDAPDELTLVGSGDLDGDGLSELVAYYSGDSPEFAGRVYADLRDGVVNPTSDTSFTLSHPGYTTYIIEHRWSFPGDLDGDGHEDVVLAAEESHTDSVRTAGFLTVLLGPNDHDRSFDDAELIIEPDDATTWAELGQRAIAGGDLDADGLADLLFSARRRNEAGDWYVNGGLFAFVGLSGGTWTLADADLLIEPELETTIQDIGVGNFGGSAAADIVLGRGSAPGGATYDGGDLLFYLDVLESPTLSLQVTGNTNGLRLGQQLALTDPDADGRDDFVAFTDYIAAHDADASAVFYWSAATLFP